MTKMNVSDEILDKVYKEMRSYFENNSITNVRVLVQTYAMYEYILYKRIQEYEILNEEELLKVQIIYKAIEYIIYDRALYHRTTENYWNSKILNDYDSYCPFVPGKEVFDFWLYQNKFDDIIDFLIIDAINFVVETNFTTIYTMYEIDKNPNYKQIIVDLELKFESLELEDIETYNSQLKTAMFENNVSEELKEKFNYHLSYFAQESKIRNYALEKFPRPIQYEDEDGYVHDCVYDEDDDYDYDDGY